jgi:hypothetical protein
MNQTAGAGLGPKLIAQGFALATSMNTQYPLCPAECRF